MEQDKHVYCFLVSWKDVLRHIKVITFSVLAVYPLMKVGNNVLL